MRKKIATHVITGFLGAGKTTAILHLLANKPDHEKWAVLVNEFGEIGIDGAILEGHGVQIREVPGGCMCCAGDVPMNIALNSLISRVKPDRLFVEPTGLGHPQSIVDILADSYYGDLLDLRAVICLVDPRRLREPRFADNAIFHDQLAIADVVAANKSDLCHAEDEAAFKQWLATAQPPKQACGWLRQGRIDPHWLELPHSGHRIAPKAEPPRFNSVRLPVPPPETIALKPGEAFTRRENRGDGYFSCGWLFAEDTRFDFHKLTLVISVLGIHRLKGVMNTDQGTCVFNAENGALSIQEIEGRLDSMVEMIHHSPIAVADIESAILSARR